MLSKTTLTFPILCLTLVLSGCFDPEEREARYLKRGNAYFDSGDYEKARIEYRNAAKIKPADPEPIYRTGLIDDAQGDMKDAFGNFMRAAQQNAEFHPALLKLAEYYMVAGLYEEAQKRLDIVLHDAPDDVQAHALLGALYYRQKNYRDAETETQSALDKDPKNIIAISVLTNLNSAQGNADKAMATVDTGLKNNPDNLSLLLIKADLYDKANDLTQADTIYQRIFATAPKEFKYRVKLALLYANAGKLDEAEKTLRDGIAALPDAWELRHQLVQFLSGHRGMDNSEKEIRALIAAYPDRPEPYGWLTDLYLSHNALDRAEASLNDTLAHRQSDAQTLALKSALARVDFAKGDKTKARQFAEETLAGDPNNLDALYIRARIEADEGAYQNATADLRAILRDRPNTPLALSVLAEIMLKQGHLDLAIETLNQLVDVDPLNLNARVRLAQFYNSNGNPQHAMDILFTLTKLEPKLALAWESTARVAIDMHDWDTADMAIGKLDALDGQHPVATYLRGQLLDNTGKPEAAIKTFQSIIDRDSASPIAEQAMAALATISERTKHLQDAIAYLAALKTDSAVAYTILGDCYLATNQPDKAKTAFDAAIAHQPAQQEAYLNRAKFYFAEHDTDRAIATLENAAAAVPSDPHAPIMQAEILTQSNRTKEAIDIYDKILTHNPDLDFVANNLAELIADNRYQDPAALDKAREIAERFALSNNPLLLDTLAWVYYRQGQNDQAHALMVRAASMKPANGKPANLPPQFHYHYGAILLAAGNNAQAMDELRQATVEGADYPGLADARNLLAPHQ